MFNFLKKKEDAPPDIGKELSDTVTEVSPDDVPVDDSPSEEESKPLVSNKNSGNSNSSSSAMDSLQLQKIQARLESFNEIMKGFNERFSILNQQIGEVRAMSIANEKNISRSEMESQKAVDIVKEVEPDKLRLDFQRIEMKTNSVSEKIEANKQFMDSIMEEVKEIKRKAGVFEGTDAIIRLSSDVKKDLVELQKMAGKVRMNTDKSEEIFIQLKSGLSSSEKLKQMIDNLDNQYVGMKKQIDKIIMERNDSMKKKEFDEFKLSIENKFKAVENAFFEAQKIKQENENIAELLEKLTLGLKRNEDDIASIAVTIGSDKLKRISDFENKLYSILEVLDKVAYEINRIKEKIGIRTISNDEQVFIPIANAPITPPATVTASNVTKKNPDILDNKNIAIVEEKNPGLVDKTKPIILEKDKPAIVDKTKPAILDKNISETNKINNNLLENVNTLDSNNTKPNITENKDLQKPIEDVKKTDELKTMDIGGLEIQKKDTYNPKSLNKNFIERTDNERKMNDLLLSGGDYLVRKDMANAIGVYKELSKIYNPAFDKNNNTYYKIIRFYENILKLKDARGINSQNEKEPETIVTFGENVK